MNQKIWNFQKISSRVSSLILVQFLITSLAMTTLAKEFSYEQFRETMHQQGLYDTTVMVPMRDGIKLSTTIYKSPVGGPYPAILVRTPYGKDDDRLDVLQLIILKGYALVVQDVRGRYGSEGEDMVFVNDGWGELQDGYDTVEWLATQSWCNGKIGTWGPSAMGITQNLMAGATPPHLVCQVIGYAASNIYAQAAYHHGVYREALVSGWLNDIGSSDLLPIFLEHPYYDSFWEQINVETKYAEINVPTIFIGGWYDIFQDATLNDFVGRQFHSAEGALGNQKLIMGPWTHVNELSQNQGELKYPTDSMLSNEVTTTINWFDYWLKGANNTAMNEPAVQYYVMGDVTNSNAPGNEWRTSDHWPIIEQDTPLYLHADGYLSTVPAGSGTLDLKVDPAQPVPTKGGGNLDLPAGPYDQISLETRNDVLVFSTEPLVTPVEVTGRIHLTLYAESNLTDNDLTVRVTDVYPDGRSMLLCDGVARASFRESQTNPTAITPGQIYAYEVDCWSTSIVFNQGHRIRILVANTNYPRFGLNPLYQKLGQGRIPAEAITKIHFSPEYPSALFLPVNGIIDTRINTWDRY